MIGPIILGISALAFLIGLFVVLWDWSVRSDPDAKYGGPIVIIAIVGLVMGGVTSCTETMQYVADQKSQQRH